MNSEYGYDDRHLVDGNGTDDSSPGSFLGHMLEFAPHVHGLPLSWPPTHQDVSPLLFMQQNSLASESSSAMVSGVMNVDGSVGIFAGREMERDGCYGTADDTADSDDDGGAGWGGDDDARHEEDNGDGAMASDASGDDGLGASGDATMMPRLDKGKGRAIYQAPAMSPMRPAGTGDFEMLSRPFELTGAFGDTAFVQGTGLSESAQQSSVPLGNEGPSMHGS